MSDEPREILFSGAAFAIPYQIGFMKYMIELLGEDFIQTCHIGGVSSGAVAACYLYSAVRTPYSIEYFYEHFVKPFFQQESKLFPG